MNAQTVVKALGGATKVAKQIKASTKRGHLTRQAVFMWERIPLAHVHTIVEMSGGKFTLEQLRPDVYRNAA